MAEAGDRYMSNIRSDEARHGCRDARIHKKFLMSNSTSHEWMFGALAEILDNATDPDVLATQFWIDIEKIGNEKCLVLTDNGKGMDNDTLYQMLCFGFSEKQEINGHKPIGRYGNGFKSGSMRLAKDAVVFTMQHGKTMSVGMLSQTYLEKIKSPTVVVPIVTWDTRGTIQFPQNREKISLEHIIKYSIFKTENELIDQCYKIKPTKNKHQGTRIVLYNLAKDKLGNLELDFYSDPTDILIPLSSQNESVLQQNVKDKTKSVSKYRTSLRKYISILYLRPRMQVILKGKRVSSICMLKCLSNKKRSPYKPKICTDPIFIDFGLNPEKDEYGILIYHRNRLIQPFRKTRFSDKRILPQHIEYNQVREIIEQTIGVVELDCVTPNHIKQNFQDDSNFRNIESNLFSRLWDYCLEIVESSEARDKELDLWVQCCQPDCQRWRRLPHGVKKDSIPDMWYCMMNPDKSHNYCEAEEESEDEAEFQKPKKKNLPNLSMNEGSSPKNDKENVEEQEKSPPQMSTEMAGFITQIMTTAQTATQPTHPTKARKRRRVSNADDIRALDTTPLSTASTSGSQRDNTDELRRLRMELDSKQARIAELEQKLEKMSISNKCESRSDDIIVIDDTESNSRERLEKLQNLVARYVVRVWPDFNPNESTVEDALEVLVVQIEALQQECPESDSVMNLDLTH